MRYIIFDNNGLITNACEWDGETEWSPPEGCVAVREEGGDIGDTYSNGVITPAPKEQADNLPVDGQE